MLPKIYIVILNYNNFIDTIECLKSLFRLSYPRYRIIVVDNQSTDNSIEYIKGWLKNNDRDFDFIDVGNKELYTKKNSAKIILIQSGENKGYGYGNNIGIKFALLTGADYVLILNNDTIVSPDFLEPLVETCEKDKSIGIASGKIYFFDRPDVIWFNGGSFNEWTGRVEHFNINEKDIGVFLEKREVTFITGCIWLIPRRVLEKVGLINEEYFMYVEDLEFCYRVRKAGFKLVVDPKSKIWHKVGSSTGGVHSAFGSYWLGRNKAKFTLENISGFKKFLSLHYQVIYLSMFWASKGRIDLTYNYIKGVGRCFAEKFLHPYKRLKK